MGRNLKAPQIIRSVLASGPKSWPELLNETNLSKGALSINLRKMDDVEKVIHKNNVCRHLTENGLRLAEREKLRTRLASLASYIVAHREPVVPSSTWAEEWINMLDSAVRIRKLDTLSLGLSIRDTAIDEKVEEFVNTMKPMLKKDRSRSE